MDKGKIIKDAFLTVGDNGIFNDNKSDKYKVAEGLLDTVIATLATETDFLFNSITTKLTSIGKNDLNENRFNVPIDYLNIVRADKAFRLEGEYLYSASGELYIQYCRKIPFEEFPDSMMTLVVMALAKKLSVAFSAYNNRYPLLEQQYEEAKRSIIYQEGFLYSPWGDA